MSEINYLYNKQNQSRNSGKEKMINFLPENIEFFEERDLSNKEEIQFKKILFIKIILTSAIIYVLFYSFYDYFFVEKKNIRVAFYNYCIRYGGIERVTSILLKYFSKEENFTFILVTQTGILEGEFNIPTIIKRISLLEQKTDIFKVIRKEHIDILINNCDNPSEIVKLNKLRSTKVIHCTHSSFFYRIYYGSYNIEETVYQTYKTCKYLLALIPLENDYLYKKWGINSLVMENPLTFDYNSVTPSELSQKNIIMIGRGDFAGKRFDLGITSMKYIIPEIPESKMYIVSAAYKNLNESVHDLNLESNVIITGFQTDPSPYLKNSSLHIFPSVSEAYPMALGEVKIFGIPSILCGLDYVILAEGGCINIYDDDPKTIAKEAIKILKDDEYRKKLGKEARESMKKLRNEIIIKKWKKLLVSIYNGLDELSFSRLFMGYNRNLTEQEAKTILNHQLNLLKKRIPRFKNLTLEKLEEFHLTR